MATALNEGHPDEAGGPTNPDGKLNPRIGAPDAGVIGGKKRELSTNVYRWDPSGKLAVAIPETQLARPQRPVLFARLQDALRDQHRAGPGDVGPGGKRVVYAFDVQGAKVANKRLFTDMMLDGIKCGPDGMRADVYGNLWISSNAPLGYAGVLVLHPGRQADRPHPPARSLRQPRLRRPQARPPVHDRQPVALRDPADRPGRRPGVHRPCRRVFGAGSSANGCPANCAGTGRARLRG